MINEKDFEKKLADFFNKLSVEEVSALRRFTMSKKWQKFFEDRFSNKMIEL